MGRKITTLAATLMTSAVLVSQVGPVAYPYNLPMQVCAKAESRAGVTDAAKPVISIKNIEGEGKDSLKVTAEITKPSDATSNAVAVTGEMKALLCYRQVKGEKEQKKYYDFTSITMQPQQDGKTYVGEVPAEKLFGDKVIWKVEAGYVDSDTGEFTVGAESNETTTPIKPSSLKGDDENATPLYITEVGAKSPSGKKMSYFEVYNQSDKAINLAYYKILYYYDYPNKTASSSGKVWSLDTNQLMLEPGKSMVYWLTDVEGATVKDFNDVYGTDLVENKDIVKVNYSGLHSSANRWIRFGTNEDDAITLAGFNLTSGEVMKAKNGLQFARPHGTSKLNESIPVEISKATPGKVEEWQKPTEEEAVTFKGYKNYPKDDGEKPTLKVCDSEGLPVPEDINEGETLKVMYDVDLLAGATSADRLAAFKDNVDKEDPQNHPGGAERLKNRPYLTSTEILYKLDDDKEWTSITERTQWRLGHYLMQIPADILFGHDKVTFKVRAYSAYSMSETEEKTVKINRVKNISGKIRLNVQDGDIISGIKTFTANDGKENKNTKISLDGKELGNQSKTLENGAYFMVKTKGMDSYFKNAITAPYGENDKEIISILSPWCEQTLSRAVHIDNKYFKYNSETKSYDVNLTLWAGDTGTPFDEIYDVVKTANHEDYYVSGLQLKLADGKSYKPLSIKPDNEKTNTSTELDVWHTIGDSAGMETSLTAAFSIPESDVDAVGAQVDTTKLSDGEHTITATADGQTVETKFIVDNQAPEITSDFEDGKVLYKSTVVEAGNLVKDAKDCDSLVVTLDGKEVELPTVIDPEELEDGEHTLGIAAADAAGNTSSKTIKFQTKKAEQKTSDHKKVSSKAENLSVNLNGETANVTFLKGESLTTENGKIAAGTVEKAGNGDSPYQIFSIDASNAKEDDKLKVDWDGTASNADSNHPLTMFVLNTQTNEWKKIALADKDGKIHGSFKAKDYVKDGKATVLVQCLTKGQKPKISAKEAQKAADEAVENAQTQWDGTGRPDSYDFSFAWETDTQYYTESFPYHYKNMNQWIVDNADDWKIRYVLHTGDIVDDCDMVGEWKNADRSMKILDDAKIPYGVLGGNHDVYAGAENYGYYWQYFGEKRFKDKDYYGGSYKNNLGHYDLISENGQDFLILYMSWDIYEDEIKWMNEVLQKYPDRKAIIALHRYSNVKETDSSILDYTGQLLQDQVVAKNKNVFAVLNGHYHGSSFQTDTFDDDNDGIKERTVYQICTDYQSDPEGGSEYLKFLYFDLKNDKVYINSYSPARNDFNYYDTPKLETYESGSDGKSTIGLSQDIAELKFDAKNMNETLNTNSISAGLYTNERIGEVKNVNDKAECEWNGLKPSTEYSWYASVDSPKSGTKDTQLKTFTTDAEKTFTLKATAGKGGKIERQDDVKEKDKAADGDTATFVITPDDGYRTSKVVIDGKQQEKVEGTIVLKNVQADHTISVEFEETGSTEIPPEQGNTTTENPTTPTTEKPADAGHTTTEKPADAGHTTTEKPADAGHTTSTTEKPAGSGNTTATTTAAPATTQATAAASSSDAVAKGTEKTLANVKYKVTSPSKKEVTVSGLKSKKLKKATISDTIKINGSSFKVTAIDKNAFAGCKSLETVIIQSKSLKQIGDKAFSKCPKLKSVTILSKTLSKIGKQAFAKDKKLTKITLSTTKLTQKNVGDKAFEGVDKNCKIKAPAKQKKLYQNIFKNRR